MADAFAASQINDTSPVPYDQVILVCQDTINVQLKNMWDLAGKDSKLRKLKVLNALGKIDAELEAPEISLNVLDKTKPIYYYLKFSSGTLKLYKSDDRDDPSTEDFDVADWVICFASQVSQKIVTKDQKTFDVYSAKMGLKDGVFSLAKLYLDATTSTLPIGKRSSYGKVNWDNYKDTTVGSNFLSFMSRWMTDMGNAEQNVIGYSALAGNTSSVNSKAPTFPPTAIDYCNYPWRDPSTKGNLQTDKNDKDGLPENAYGYLITTQFKTSPKARELAYSGSFVNKAHGAVLCMSCELFWESWLLKLLKKLAQGTEMIPFTPTLKDVTAEAQKKNPDITRSIATGPYFGFGVNEDHKYGSDIYFDLTRSGAEWAWNGTTLTKSAKLDFPDATFTATDKAQSSMRVTFVSGGEKVLITGGNSFNFEFRESDSGYATLKVETSWHLNFILAAVNDGGLQITRVPDPAGISAATSTYTFDTHEISWKYPFESFVNSITGSLQSWFNDSLAWLTNDLIVALEHHHKLFLPASGVFLMEHPHFNKRGDLLVGLHYNGAKPPVDTGSGTKTDTSGKTGTSGKAALGATGKVDDGFLLAGDNVPEAFRHLPVAWRSLPPRQSLLPIVPGSDIPVPPTSVPEPVPVFS